MSNDERVVSMIKGVAARLTTNHGYPPSYAQQVVYKFRHIIPAEYVQNSTIADQIAIEDGHVCDGKICRVKK